MSDEPPGGWTPGGPVWPQRHSDQPVPGQRLRDLLAERLPPGLRGGRIDLGGRGAVALAGLALVAAVAALVFAWRSQARPVAAPPAPSRAPAVAVPAPSPDGDSAQSVGAASQAGGSQSGGRPGADAGPVVEVGGKVRRPGVVSLAAGARVNDAIKAAGGLLPGASTEGLSLARRVIDGEQLLVGVPPPSGSPPGAGAPPSAAGTGTSAGSPIDLNTATVADLDGLPGIGPVLAERIVAWRDEHGGFTSVEQLGEVSGLGEKKFEALAGLVRV